MLHLRKSIEFPHLTQRHEVALSPVRADDGDELLQDIAASHEEPWQLVDIDSAELDKFWTGVQEDLESDPTWFNFADEEE